MNLRLLASLALLVAGAAQRLNADMGRILTTSVTVEETAQKAIILHNLTQEVLILGTDLEGAGPAGLVRFIPFPSEPQVNIAPPQVFENLMALVEAKHLRYVTYTKSHGAGAGAGVELRLSEKLGEHDLAVIKVNDLSVFRSWVDDYFKRKGFPPAKGLDTINQVVEEYVHDGLNYFVIDYVALPAGHRFIDPLVMAFKSNQLYYPLRTSNTFGGSGDIVLFLLTPRTLFHGPIFNFPGDGYSEPSTSAQVTPAEIHPVFPAADAFFGQQPVFLQTVRWHGPYSFDRDLRLDLRQGIEKSWEISNEKPTQLDSLFEGLAPEKQ
jgi:hypothetical protein